MSPRDFPLEGPADLPVFADFLADCGHPGEATIRRLVREGKYPHHLQLGINEYGWFQSETDNGHEVLPPDTISPNPRWTFFVGFSGAIWALIESGNYQ